MPLAPGTKLGPYEILSVAGEGGMGAVYKARDSRLDRSVAIKTLHPGRAVTEEMRQRFQAEARAISRLNHPHVCTLHDVGQDSGVDYLVLEFVDAQPLDRLIPKGGMRLDEVLAIGWQVADALATAHRAGIVHRDLKPGNVMVNERGQVKVLDFGLAKLGEIAATAPLGQDDRTLTHVAQTSEGTIVGTVSYMSPEQAEGKPVDARSDIFSFGVLLYEMATGRRPFTGDTRMAIAAAIINQEPAPLGDGYPVEFQRLLERCLRKAPARRVQGMDDVRVLLEDMKEDSASGRLTKPSVATPLPPKASAPKWAWAAGAIAAVAVAAALWWRPTSTATTEPTPDRKISQLTALPGREQYPTFSPDGSQVAFSWTGESGDNTDIYVKVIGTEKPLRLTTDPGTDTQPAWSPDGRWIAFVRVDPKGGLTSYLAIPPTGGPERKLAEVPPTIGVTGINTWLSPSWLADSKSLIITDGVAPTFLSSVSLESGERTRITQPETSLFGDGSAAVSSDGSLLAFTRLRGFGDGNLYLQRLEAGRPVGEPRKLTNPPGQFSGAVFLPSGKDLIFEAIESRLGTGLFRLPVDDPSRIVSLALPTGRMATLSRDGSRLAFVQTNPLGAKIFRLTLGPDRKGLNSVMTLQSSRMDQFPRYSPDGQRIAFESERSGSREVWVAKADGTGATQLTFSNGPHTTYGLWSPDGRQLIFSSTVTGTREIYTIRADGGAPRALTTTNNGLEVPSGWSRDGQWVYLSRGRQRETWKMRADGRERIQVAKDAVWPRETPDGKALVLRTPRGLRKLPLLNGMPSGSGTEWELPGGGLGDLYHDVTDNGAYFARRGGPSISYLDFASGRITLVWTCAGRFGLGLSVSPDEKTLLYSESSPSPGLDLSMIENFR